MAGVQSVFDEASEKMEEQIQYVAKEIGGDWRKLGRKLKIKDCIMEGIVEEYTSTEERAYQTLKKWSHANGSGATTRVLCKALKAIERRSIAERIEHRHSSASPDKPFKQDTVKANSRRSPDRSPSSKHQSDNFGKFNKTLDDMFGNCIKNLSPDTDRCTLVGTMTLAQHLITLNNILMNMIETDLAEYTNGYGAELKRIHISCKTRSQQTEQTVCLILRTLTEQGQAQPGKPRNTRTFSETLPRCTSEVKLEPRSGTFSGISSPLSTSRQCLLGIAEIRGSSPLREEIFEEDPLDTETSEDVPHEYSSEDEGEDVPREPCHENEGEDVAGCIPRCQSCGSCLYFEARIHGSENQETSLDDNCNKVSEPCPSADEAAIDELLHELQDSK